MAGVNGQSPSLVVLLLNRHPRFQQAEHTPLQSLKTGLSRPPCKQAEAKAQRVAAVTGGCSTSTGRRLPGLLLVALCRTRCCSRHACWPGWDSGSGTAGRPPLPRQVLQAVPSAPWLPPAPAADEPSWHQPGEPHAMLRLLGIASSESTLVAPHHRAGLEKGICCYCWYHYRSQQAGVISPLAAFYCPSQGSQPRSWLPPALPKPPRAHGSRAAARPDPAGPVGSRPEPGTCGSLARCRPDHPAQGNVTGHLHVGRLEGLEETGLSSAAPIAAARDINTRKEISYK